MAQSTDSAVFASRLQSQHSQSLGNDNALDFVVWRWDTLENLKSLHGGGTTGGLVRNHTTDGLVEDSGWGTEMERTYSRARQDVFLVSNANRRIAIGGL